ncbi:MAG: DNA polymerase III subunit beta [Candidatus Thermofonsia Clade 1 bacterium]|jgi:DNA polymerase-3 subunit beta|uniref:Beta sliding clamp n=1 Tax=Candidatus Thermofonsia Clade 1 bacterium TaxID=2364210 RepID=A0A2M8PXX0_9CHLR|nr:MAG: DNA polymerase III subunit beta [Candidatus Thermofonsia Clade 1 bacterium]PJF42396.1 MAG: DNA polymerase III subunit beta [Candidatus Thermofonsia Clade 1 bacterium]RMF51558.1 MAG: DNA polymerase III subunit beta [Chloroflexota bacterium]
MQVSVLQEHLAKGLDTIARAVANRPSIPILSNVLIATEDGRLKLCATNLELAITARLGAQVDANGETTVPARLLTDLVKSLPSQQIDLRLEGNKLKLHCNGSHWELPTTRASDFPNIPELPERPSAVVPADVLSKLIDQVVFSAAKEDNRPVLMGVLTRFEGPRASMIAADGYRMAMRRAELNAPVNEALTLLIPATSLSEVARIIRSEDGDVHIAVMSGRNQAIFHHKNVDIVSQLIDGKFPEVEQLIPKQAATSTRLDLPDFLAVCKRAEIFARDANGITRFKISTSGEVLVSAQASSGGGGSERLPAEVTGKDIDIAFNVRYLIEVLSVLETKRFVLETNNANAPGVVRPVTEDGEIDPSFVYLVMPMSVR